MYKYVLNSVVKISMMFAKYSDDYTILLRGGRFLWTSRLYIVRRCGILINICVVHYFYNF